MRIASRIPLAALGLLAAFAEPQGQQAPGRWLAPPQQLPSPAGPGSAQPQLTVSDRGVLLSWVESAGGRATLRFAERTADGWTPPRTVASGTDWFVNWADVPSVIRMADGTLAAHWLQKSGPGTYAYDVRLSYSTDDGRTWAPSFRPHHDGTPTEHGFAALFQDPGGGLGLVWLDGRAMQAGSHGHGAGDMALRYAAFDRAWTQTTEVVVDARVCECCPTTAVVTADGPVVAYRNRAADETRDIYVARLDRGAWTAPAPAHDDGWRIHACPVNGPMLSARGAGVALAWFTARGDAPQAYAAFSGDGGRSFGPPVRLDDGAPTGRVDVELLPDGSAAVSYLEVSDGRALFNVRRVEPSGARSGTTTVAGMEDGRASGYPRMALHGGELTFAWVDRGAAPPVRTASVRLTR